MQESVRYGMKSRIIGHKTLTNAFNFTPLFLTLHEVMR